MWILKITISAGCADIINFFIYLAGVKPSPLLLGPLVGLLYESWMRYGNECVGITN